MKLCFLISISILAVLSLSHCAGADAMPTWTNNQMQELREIFQDIDASQTVLREERNEDTAQIWKYLMEDLNAEIQELKDSQKVLREELRQEIQERKASQKDTTAIWEEIHSLNASLVSVEAFLYPPNYITEMKEAVPETGNEEYDWRRGY